MRVSKDAMAELQNGSGSGSKTTKRVIAAVLFLMAAYVAFAFIRSMFL